MKSYCNHCIKDTNHKVLYTETDSYRSDEISCDTQYMIIKCLGCDNISFRKDYNDDTMPSFDPYGEPNNIITIYPERTQVIGLKEIELPRKIRTIYRETIKAINSNCLLLAAVGFRAVIEAICAEKEVGDTNLEDKINKLRDGGFITNDNSKPSVNSVY